MNEQEMLEVATQNVSIPAWGVLAVILLMVAIWYISRGCPKVEKLRKELLAKSEHLDSAFIELEEKTEEAKIKLKEALDRL